MKDLIAINGKDVESFGGKDLAANMDRAELAIAELETDFRVFNHSNSQFVWGLFILNHKGSLRNVRQIAAEINKKKNALIENKYRYLEGLAEADVWREELEAENSPAKKKLLRVKIEKVEKMADLALAPIEGALKDIITLHAHYKKILEQFSGYTEADFEKEEISYWIRRCFSQCLRDIRQFGTMTKGEQEPLESMGLNITRIRGEMLDYLNNVELKTEGGECLDEFLDKCVEKYSPVVLGRVNLIEDSCF